MRGRKGEASTNYLRRSIFAAYAVYRGPLMDIRVGDIETLGAGNPLK